jgi:hypothetical protein
MSKPKSSTPAPGSSELTSARVPWSEVGDAALLYVEWLDARYGPSETGSAVGRSNPHSRGALNASCFARQSSNRIKADGRC